MIHVGLSIRIYLLELNYLFEGVNRFHEHSMVKFVSTRGYLIPHTCVYKIIQTVRGL